MREPITSREMGALDLNCEYFGLSRLQLMENAGKAVADEILKRFSGGKVVLFAGSGNNAGDGFVAVRFLKGFDVDVVLARDVKSELARRNLDILVKAGFSVFPWQDYDFDYADIVIDGLLGTGFRGELRRPYSDIVRAINESESFVVSIDVPSGMNADSGEYREAVKADLTVTFHRPKPGLSRSPEIAGEVVVADIGIPEEFEKLAGPGDFRLAYRRFEDGHKGSHGKVLVVGGYPYVGAPFLAAYSTYKAGADIVTLAVPESVYPQVSSFSPEIIPRKLRGDEITEKNVEEITELARKHDVVVFGMGTVDKGDVAEEISKGVEKIVLDAGGLTATPHCRSILTPHRQEFERVFGYEASEESVLVAANSIDGAVLLKGKRDIVSDGRRVKYNDTGNAGMTVGGTGDVLAGVAGALFAICDDPFHAACAAAFITGLAGDMCLEEKGYNFTALDVAEKIPYAVKKVMELK
ncbi:putative sugar kinase [Geoglobus ahangari]|uniref:Bifunctional NAD(P)H-hydrate repair enzyme n=1 Tax=Geoglobus ahangari TaxID=113653 RepID=A0A0F7IBZ0_9EURY|nr:bifunctional ADP-dependent NAD(P)H-hydrate dehydratase/NAD(P)H-hydrate epimerase [Geoglobus ahangari]AKG90720.1 putative sugar kinase [Geoglobus ahangari]